MLFVIFFTGIIGLAILAFGVFLFFRRRAFVRRATKGKGKIVAYAERTVTDSENRSTTYSHPVVEFTTTSGQLTMYTDEFRTQWPWPKKKVGAAVPILYDSDNPQDAHISSLRQLWGRVIGVLFVGSGCVIASMILVIVW